MPDYLVDTNVLLRATNPADSLAIVTLQAVTKLLNQGDTIYVTAQNIIEFWSVATRPASVNGLGWSLTDVTREVQAILAQFPLLEDKPEIFNQWLQLASHYGVQGKQVHDLRLVATMRAHSIANLLTFNEAHFARYTEITAVSPAML